MIAPLYFYGFIVIFGAVMIFIGRSLNTHAQEEWKGEHWWRELILRPPGYYRASAILGGSLIIIIGVVGFFYELISRFLD